MRKNPRLLPSATTISRSIHHTTLKPTPSQTPSSTGSPLHLARKKTYSPFIPERSSSRSIIQIQIHPPNPRKIIETPHPHPAINPPRLLKGGGEPEKSLRLPLADEVPGVSMISGFNLNPKPPIPAMNPPRLLKGGGEPEKSLRLPLADEVRGLDGSYVGGW